MSGWPVCYLAGGIAGLDADTAGDWRETARRLLRMRDIESLNPMRGKSAAFGNRKISRDFRDYEHNGPFFTSRGIMARDFNDVKRCDVLFANLWGMTTPSMGTIVELGWAWVLQKPVVAWIESQPSANPHLGHPMVHAAMTFRFDDFDDAIDAVAVLLGR